MEARLHACDLDEVESGGSFSARLQAETGWDTLFTARTVQEYKRFVYLSVTAPHPVAPSREVDLVWRLHLAYTRHYWDYFCPRIVGQALHHAPVPLGPERAVRYRAHYEATLAVYTRAFGSPPPADIWPAGELRFARQAPIMKVNAHRYWLVPKPFGGWRFAPARALLRGFGRWRAARARAR